MGKGTKYVARQPDSSGLVRYSDEENRIWATLYERQDRAIRGKACDEFFQGLALLKMPRDRIPQLPEISKVLKRETGWEVAYVPALIPFSEFFKLLADRKFPAATFIRTREELDYLQEPDIFHEIFGHTPLLTSKYFADFTHTYGKLGLAASKEDRVFLARMYWFTVEFGLIQPPRHAQVPAADTSSQERRPPGQPMRIYGGGILSSIGETEYAWSSDKPQRKRFQIMDALRTPYRIDIMQPLYYYLEDLRELYELTKLDLMGLIAEAKRKGLFPPLYPPKAEPSGVTKLASNM